MSLSYGTFSRGWDEEQEHCPDYCCIEYQTFKIFKAYRERGSSKRKWERIVHPNRLSQLMLRNQERRTFRRGNNQCQMPIMHNHFLPRLIRLDLSFKLSLTASEKAVSVVFWWGIDCSGWEKWIGSEEIEAKKLDFLFREFGLKGKIYWCGWQSLNEAQKKSKWKLWNRMVCQGCMLKPEWLFAEFFLKKEFREFERK